jgi:hypothetical protein
MTKRIHGLDRVAGFVRASIQAARPTEQLASISRRQMNIPISARGLAVKAKPQAERQGSPGSGKHSERDRARDEIGNVSQATSANAMQSIDGFGSNLKALEAAVRFGKGFDRPKMSRAKSVRESSGGESGARGLGATLASNDGFSRLIQKSEPGMKALTRIQKSERQFGLGNDLSSTRANLISVAATTKSGSSWAEMAGRANRTVGLVGRLSVGNDESSSRSDGASGSVSRARMWSGPKASMVAPMSLARPEFSEPARNIHGQESGSATGPITINSTPTVVINAVEASGDVERQVIGALRAHRDELFDQFKRESIRRERSQF